MASVCELPGRVTSDGLLEVDGLIPLSEGPVRVRIAAPEARHVQWPDEPEWHERRARLLSLAGAISDDEATSALKAIERECEQINLDDWH